MDTLSMLVESNIALEKLRVQVQVRNTHLIKNGTNDGGESEELLEKLKDIEQYLDSRITPWLKRHPAYPWFSRVKGIGNENIGKVLYEVRVKPEKGEDKEGNEIALPYADTVSALWAFAGMAVVEGHAPKRTKGSLNTYNAGLRTMCWRVGTSLLRAQGKFAEYYYKEKEKYEMRYTNAGVKIVPALSLPKVAGKKTETAEYISEGHIHNMAMRKMLKMFLSCLWLSWRELEGLPVTKPYPIDRLGHDSLISPWDMLDR